MISNHRLCKLSLLNKLLLSRNQPTREPEAAEDHPPQDMELEPAVTEEPDQPATVCPTKGGKRKGQNKTAGKYNGSSMYPIGNDGAAVREVDEALVLSEWMGRVPNYYKSIDLQAEPFWTFETGT